MKSYLLIFTRLFKTWFLPSPPHDSYQVSSAPAQQAMVPEKPVEKNTAWDNNDPSVTRSIDTSPDTPEHLPDFSHLVKPPEGALSRSSRSKSTTDENTPE